MRRPEGGSSPLIGSMFFNDLPSCYFCVKTRIRVDPVVPEIRTDSADLMAPLYQAFRQVVARQRVSAFGH